MIKALLTAIRLIWLGANTTTLKFKMVGSILSGVVQGFVMFFTPFVLSLMVKNISEGNVNGTINYFYLLVVLAGFLVFGRFIWRFFFENIGVVIPLNIKQIYYKKIFDKPYEWHLHNSVGYFSSALDRVCNMLHGWLWKLPFDYIASGIMMLCFFIYSYTLSLYAFLYFFFSVLVMGIIIRILYTKRIKYIEAYTKSTLSFNKTFIDFLYNVRSVKKMNLLEFAQKNSSAKAKVSIDKGVKMYAYNSYQWGFMEFFVHAQFLLPIGYYIFQFVKTGEGIEIIVMLAGIKEEMARVGRLFMSLMHEIAATQTEYKVLAEHIGEDFSTPEKERGVKKWQRILFEDTKFTFIKDGNKFVHKIESFEINPGDHIAVMGKSGEGKSTFLNLLTNQYNVEEGHIYVDKTDYKDLPSSFFDTNITYISQDVELFDMTLYDNIVMGKRISTEALQKIVDGCCLNELIERMDGDMHTDIGEKGVKVSGGEKQRINLARGLLLNRDILVLDEITANLDPYTTEKIWEFIFTEYNDKTIVAVSHEKELLNHVNKKLEFRKGKGVEIK